MSSKLLIDGNAKTGPQIALFNLPRIDTCPGASELCRKVCYAKTFKRFPQTEAIYKEAWRRSRTDRFVTDMVAEIRARGVREVRIHTVGDFYDARYAGRWLKIARMLPDVVFYTYTRSWRIPAIRRVLTRLARLPNVQLWWSTDSESGPTPEGHTAYMAVDDQDRPAFDASLVFRVRRGTYRSSVAGVPVCPKERCQSDHARYPKNLTCHTCGVCFRLARRAVLTAPAATSKRRHGE